MKALGQVGKKAAWVAAAIVVVCACHAAHASDEARAGLFTETSDGADYSTVSTPDDLAEDAQRAAGTSLELARSNVRVDVGFTPNASSERSTRIDFDY